MINTKIERPTPPKRNRSAGYRASRRKPKSILHRFLLFFKRGKWKYMLAFVLVVLAVLFLLHRLIFSSNGSDATATYTPEPSDPPELTIEPEDKPQTYIFMDDKGYPVDWEHLTDAWAAEAGYEKRYPLTDAERLEIAQVITAEAAGEPFAGKVAVAQCILQTCEDEGLRPAEVLEKYKYSKRRPEPTAEALEAVEAVFDFGHVATSEPIRYFYAPELIESAWHESQVYVMTINNHKFFKEKSR